MKFCEKMKKIRLVIKLTIPVAVGFLFLNSCSKSQAALSPLAMRTSPYPEHTLKVRQEWTFGDFVLKVEETAVVMLPQKGPLFVVKTINNEITDEQERKAYALKIASLVYKHKIYEQANYLTVNNKPIEPLPIIGICIFEQQGGGFISKLKGHRYQFPFDELESKKTNHQAEFTTNTNNTNTHP